MISVKDIQLIVASGEGYNAEFKISVPSKAKELTGEDCGESCGEDCGEDNGEKYGRDCK